MNHAEPSWEPANADLAGLDRDLGKSDRYEIAYGSGIYQRRDEYLARSFKAVGAIAFADGQLRIQAVATRLFGANIQTDLHLGPQHIYNVVVSGRLVRFETTGEGRGLRMIVLRAKTRREAREIASRLPDTKTPSFAAEAATLENFLDGVETLTPRVWVTWAIVALNALVYVIMVGSGGGFPKISSQSSIAFGSNFGPNTLNGESWRLLTSMFVHLSLAHIALNMLILAYVGVIVERLYGNARFAALYVFAGLTASLTSLCLHYQLNSTGASGAIFGVLGALLAYVIRFRSTMPRRIHAQRFRAAAWIVVYSLFTGITHPGIDNAAHIGGLVAGVAMGWILARSVAPAEPHMDARHASALACTLAAFAFAALGWQAVRASSSPAGRDEMAFSVMAQQEGLAEQKATADLKVLASMAKTPSRQAEFAAKIESTVWPEWNALYERMSSVPLPPGSPRAPFRDAMLRYYDDMRQALLAMADVATLHASGDSPASSKVKALLADAKLQRAEAIRLAARH